MREYAIIIVGAGPAGSAAAIQLANRRPELAARTLVLERGVFPRRKLCAGGITAHVDGLLQALDVTLDVSSFPVHAVRFVFEDLEFTFRRRNAFRVVQREEFDMALARTAQARGVRLCEGEVVRDLVHDGAGVRVVTNRDEYRALVVIGADGANSVVRQKLGLACPQHISRLMEVFTSGEGISSAGFVEHTAVFDFTPITCGVQGYYWDFPAIQRGTPTMNRGLFDARVRPDRPRARLKPVFEGELAGRGVRLHEVPLLGHPERWFDAREPQAGPRVVLAGDAAGAEPLLGEGISYALNFGVVAAEAVIDAFAREDFSFSGYNRRVMRSALGRHLRLKRFVAHYAYGKRGRWFYRLGWRTLGLLVRVHGLSGRGCEVAKL